MYLGKLCEIGPPQDLYQAPAHPYTAALLSAIPVPDPRVRIDSSNHLAGDLPSPIDPPSGCRFRTRCPIATEVCAHAEPQMQPIDSGHFVACHHPLVTPMAVAPRT
jgi:peptide/nickel transport system ATP-binding protein